MKKNAKDSIQKPKNHEKSSASALSAVFFVAGRKGGLNCTPAVPN
jgi:hypothetical protein